MLSPLVDRDNSYYYYYENKFLDTAISQPTITTKMSRYGIQLPSNINKHDKIPNRRSTTSTNWPAQEYNNLTNGDDDNNFNARTHNCLNINDDDIKEFKNTLTTGSLVNNKRSYKSTITDSQYRPSEMTDIYQNDNNHYQKVTKFIKLNTDTNLKFYKNDQLCSPFLTTSSSSSPSSSLSSPNDSKHLIKTVSDLPVFTTIEGYRVASYSIAGEPHLCLAQLLQYLKQDFYLDSIIDIFEETVTNFTDSTPKQVEGFIKVSVIPSNANSCPLIKYSDANRICLKLFDQCNKNKQWNNIVNLCSWHVDRGSIPNKNGQVNNNYDIKDNPNISNKIDLKQDNNVSNKESTEKRSETLFEFEAQETILDLAKAVTSVLIIRIYHRCFGKCTGSYYPSLLKDSESNCIECNSCHVMLAPRRFIGHTHGTKEPNVCHWGFNSYNWRHYIRLSKKQTSNNLDDDELLFQFDRLLSAKDYDLTSTKNNYNDFKTTIELPLLNDSDRLKSSNNHSNDINQNEFENNNSYTQSNVASSSSMCSHHTTKSESSSTNVYPLASGSSSKSIGIPHLQPTTSNHVNVANLYQPIINVDKNATYQARISEQPLRSSKEIKYNEMYSSNPLMSTLDYLSSLGDGQLIPFTSSIASADSEIIDGVELSSNLSNDIKNQSEYLNKYSALNKETKREMFIVNNLTTYLMGKGISSTFTKEIIDNTLNIVRSSNKLF